jgi:hypothetical protein
MASEGKEGVVYSCGEWEHGQLGLPLSRTFLVDGNDESFDIEVSFLMGSVCVCVCVCVCV